MQFYWKYRFVIPIIGAILAAIWLNRAEASPEGLRPFEGAWSGRCVSLVGGPASWGMLMTVRERGIGSHDWIIRYEGQPSRRYVMVAQQSPGHYVLDERNGILIDHYLQGGVLRDQFEVGGSRISTTTWIADGRLVMTFETFGVSPVRESWSNDGQYRVRAFRPTSIQRCELERQ